MDREAPQGAILAATAGEDELAAIGGAHARHSLPVANVPIVRYALAALARCGVRRAAIVVSAATAPAVRAALAGGDEPGVELTWFEHPEPPPFATAIDSLAGWLDGTPLLVHDGDSLFSTPIEPFVERFAADRPDALLLTSAGDARDHDERRSQLRLVGALAPDDALAGAHVLGPSAVAAAVGLAGELPERQSLAALASEMRARGAHVELGTASGAWRYDGSVDGLLEANRMVLDEVDRDVEGADLANAQVQGRVVVHPTAALDRTTVRGPAVIGPHAVLVDTFVGPYTAVGAHARLDGAEISYSVVLDHAAVRHPGRRLEASLIGHGARVGREFGLPAALRLRVGRQAEVSLG